MKIGMEAEEHLLFQMYLQINEFDYVNTGWLLNNIREDRRDPI